MSPEKARKRLKDARRTGRRGRHSSHRRKAHMHKQRVLRTPLLAVLGFLAFLAVPAAAQAHHIGSVASCTLTNNVRTVTLQTTFYGFSPSARPTVRGSVRLEGVQGSEQTW